MTDEEALKCAHRIIEAQQRLLVAYRTGGRTPATAIDTLRREVPKWDEWRAFR